MASHAADSLNCETAYQFRVSAYGSGTNYAQDWSEPSLPVSEATTECTSPVFDPWSYTFALAEGAAVDDVVGTVTARHPGGGSLTYSITAGNDDGNFNIDGTSGEITAAAIDTATASLTTLTIEAAATGIQSATATVEIYIARTPNGFSVAPSGGHEFTISWNSVDYADEYTVQSREPGGDWVSLVTTSTGITISNLLCDRTHQFQVAARVQGVMSPYTDPVVEASCNVPPTFGSGSYSFPVLEDAAIRDVVGQVSATDTEAESLTYSITGGNEAGHFSIDSATGEIRVAGALDYDVISEYNLTVGATDGNKGVVAVTVQVLIEALLEPSAACRNGVTVLAPDSNTGLVEDCVVLLTHRDTLGGAAALNWSQNVVIATWDGVSLSSPSNRVGGLFLADLGLTGTIPAGLGDLDSLTRLELDGNQLTGTIPAALGNLGNLRYLYLDNNRLTGQIPRQIGNLAELRVLYLGNNQLEGPLPTEFGDLSNLIQLIAVSNQLTGDIPTELTGLTNLIDLWLSRNQLSGPIPTGLGDLVNLQNLNLGHNELTGTIPTELGNLTDLVTLYLNTNGLEGPLPTQLGDLAGLEVLYISNNQLTGGIPSELGNLTKLLQLILSDNQLTGQIPASLGDLKDLEELQLRYNNLNGQIPATLENLSNLESLYLKGNSLTGCLPSTLRDTPRHDLDQLGLTDCS